MHQTKLTAENIASTYRNACMAELQALKPGNVHIFSDGHGMTIHDFIKSADASSPVIASPELSVGDRIHWAMEATQKAVGMNTNLGVLLLCAPLVHAVLHQEQLQTLQQSLISTLNSLTVKDAQLASQAIVLANPAGLGSVEHYDVNQEPASQHSQVTLLEMMHSAQGRDRIAWQYANEFSDIFNLGVPRYAEAMDKWQNQAWATTALYLSFLSNIPDTHVIRKYGETLAIEIMNEARQVDAEYWLTDNPKLIQKKLLDWDASLKSRKINPGTSADLTVASLLVSFLESVS